MGCNSINNMGMINLLCDEEIEPNSKKIKIGEELNEPSPIEAIAKKVGSLSLVETVTNEQMEQYLNDLYSKTEYNPIQFCVPYNGRLGTYPAEIYCTDYASIQQIEQNLMPALKLVKDTDVLYSNVNCRDDKIKQIILMHDKALKIFKEAVLEERLGIVPKDVLIQAIPSLDDLIIDSGKKQEKGEIIQTYTAKDEEALEQAEAIIRTKLESLDSIPFGDQIKKDECSGILAMLMPPYKIYISSSALQALKSFCNSPQTAT